MNGIRKKDRPSLKKYGWVSIERNVTWPEYKAWQILNRGDVSCDQKYRNRGAKKTRSRAVNSRSHMGVWRTADALRQARERHGNQRDGGDRDPDKAESL